MTDYFFDASALIKRYLVEQGTRWTVALTDGAPDRGVLLVEITLAEIAAGLSAKHRAPRGISMAARDRALARFLHECSTQFLLIPVSRTMIDMAVGLTQQYRLRGYDAVQLAAALVANQDLLAAGHAAIVVVSADHDLLEAARAEGLATDNPLDHADLDPPS